MEIHNQTIEYYHGTIESSPYMFVTACCIYLFCIIYFLFKLQDVAVKVLTDQDFHDDHLKDFLREACIDFIHEINVFSSSFLHLPVIWIIFR